MRQRMPDCASCFARYSSCFSAPAYSTVLEPISKLLQQHGDGGELHKTQEVSGVIFPANQQAPLPLQPGKEPLDEPAALIPSQMATVLGLECSGGPVRRDH